MIRSHFISTRVALTLAAALAYCTAPARATVIFEEHFHQRGLFQPMLLEEPWPVNTGNAVFQKSPELGTTSQTWIDVYEGGGDLGLLFKPFGNSPSGSGGTGAGGHNQNMWLPYNYTLGADVLRLTLTVRQAQPRWNNFAFGFVGQTGGYHSFVLLQTNSTATQHTVQVVQNNASPTNTTVPSPAAAGMLADQFRTFVLEYDPTKVQMSGVTPYSFSVDGNPISLNGSNVPAMNMGGENKIFGIGFGFQFGNGNFDRTALLHSMKFEILSSASPTDPGDFNEDGLVDGADFLAWQRGNSPNELTAGDLQEWRDAFGTVYANVASTPIPEPGTWALAALALAGFAARRFGRCD